MPPVEVVLSLAWHMLLVDYSTYCWLLTKINYGVEWKKSLVIVHYLVEGVVAGGS